MTVDVMDLKSSETLSAFFDGEQVESLGLRSLKFFAEPGARFSPVPGPWHVAGWRATTPSSTSSPRCGKLPTADAGSFGLRWWPRLRAWRSWRSRSDSSGRRLWNARPSRRRRPPRCGWPRPRPHVRHRQTSLGLPRRLHRRSPQPGSLQASTSCPLRRCACGWESGRSRSPIRAEDGGTNGPAS